MVGVDAQPGYLARARAWAEREGLAADLRLRDMAALELDEMLREAGFRDVAFYGDLDRSPPSLDSYTIVAVGTR